MSTVERCQALIDKLGEVNKKYKRFTSNSVGDCMYRAFCNIESNEIYSSLARYNSELFNQRGEFDNAKVCLTSSSDSTEDAHDTMVKIDAYVLDTFGHQKL